MSDLNTEPALSQPRRDQRIIDLTLAGDDQALRRFSKRAGVELEAIRARARKLGLTARVVKACRLAGTRAAMRDCLRCDDRFLSRGRHNRLCRRCARRS